MHWIAACVLSTRTVLRLASTCREHDDSSEIYIYLDIGIGNE